MKKKYNKIISMILAVVICLSTTTAFASSTGSTSSDTSVGADTVQGATTKYTEMGEGSTDTEVYLTVDDSNVVVGVPTEIIVSGTPTETGKYIGEYSVIAEGDLAGNKTIRIEPEGNVVLKQAGKSDVTATISQEKTSFTYNDIITDANTSTGEVVAEGLTAGSWKGEFVFNVKIVTPITAKLLDSRLNEYGLTFNYTNKYIYADDNYVYYCASEKSLIEYYPDRDLIAVYKGGYISGNTVECYKFDKNNINLQPSYSSEHTYSDEGYPEHFLFYGSQLIWADVNILYVDTSNVYYPAQ